METWYWKYETWETPRKWILVQPNNCLGAHIDIEVYEWKTPLRATQADAIADRDNPALLKKEIPGRVEIRDYQWQEDAWMQAKDPEGAAEDEGNVENKDEETMK